MSPEKIVDAIISLRESMAELQGLVKNGIIPTVNQLRDRLDEVGREVTEVREELKGHTTREELVTKIIERGQMTWARVSAMLLTVLLGFVGYIFYTAISAGRGA